VYDDDIDPYDLIDGILSIEETLIDPDMWIK
jgi:hypothetical protein